MIDAHADDRLGHQAGEEAGRQVEQHKGDDGLAGDPAQLAHIVHAAHGHNDGEEHHRHDGQLQCVGEDSLDDVEQSDGAAALVCGDILEEDAVEDVPQGLGHVGLGQGDDEAQHDAADQARHHAFDKILTFFLTHNFNSYSLKNYLCVLAGLSLPQPSGSERWSWRPAPSLPAGTAQRCLQRERGRLVVFSIPFTNFLQQIGKSIIYYR